MSASSLIGLSFVHLFIAFLFAFLRILTSKPIHGLPICCFSDIFHIHTWLYALNHIRRTEEIISIEIITSIKVNAFLKCVIFILDSIINFFFNIFIYYFLDK
jgi:hypothetical protein